MRSPFSRFAFVIAVLAFVSPGPPRSAGRRPASLDIRVEGVEDADRLALRLERVSRRAQSARERQTRPAPGPVTGTFGERRGRHIHTGIDINGESGDAVVALMWGTVVHAGPAVKGYTGYGNMVRIDHGDFETVYAHLSRIDVTLGDVVNAGELVGAIGTSGSVTGSHLHFEVRIAGKPVDPAGYTHVI